MRVSLCIFLAFSCFGAAFRAASHSPVLAFEARGDQYVSRGAGYALSVTARGAALNVHGRSMRLSLQGANAKPALEPLDRMPGKANYILGPDARASYGLYGRVRWAGVYPGIDVVFHGNKDHLEYDFEIAARRDPRKIQLAFEGVDAIHIDPAGDLLLRAGAVEIRQPKPFAYQIVAGAKRPVDVAYWIDASNRVRFQTAAYDHNRPLVIDPEIVFDQTFGGSGQTQAYGLARDSQGNLYVTGSTNSVNFPTVNAVQSQVGSAPLIVSTNGGQSWSNVFLGDAVGVNVIAAAPSAPLVAYALTPSGIFSTSDGGSTWNAAAGAGLPPGVTPPAETLAVDAKSPTTLYVGGYLGPYISTNGGASWQPISNGLPGTNVTVMATSPTQAGTVFVAVSASAALFRSTNFGQTWTQLSTPAPSIINEPIQDLAIASSGTIIAASQAGPFIISSDNGSTWVTGANQGATNNQALAISPANPNTVYLAINTGVLLSTNGAQSFTSVLSFPAAQPASLVTVDPRNPSTVYAATFGLLYRSTNAGQTWSELTTPYPTGESPVFVSPANSAVFAGSGIQSTSFVTKWSPDGSQMLYSTYLVGNGSSAIAVDGSGSAYITGNTNAASFPVTPGAYKSNLALEEIFVAKLSPDGSQVVYAALLGNGSNVSAIAVDSSGEAVVTGTTQGNYPTTPNALPTPPLQGCTLNGPFPYTMTTGAAFVTKLSASGGALVYSTFLSGTCATSGIDVAIDSAGNAWVVGSTLSSDFPVTSDALQPKYGGGAYDGDGYLARFSPSGGLEYATYIGGPAFDTLNALAFDQSGNIYLTGQTAGLSQPSSPNAYQPKASASCQEIVIGPGVYEPMGNAVVLKLDPQAHSVLGLTYEGAPGCLSPTSIAVDSSGEPWIAGAINPAGNSLPAVGPVEIGGLGFISKFSADFTQLLFSTQFNPLAGLALDSSAAYVAGTTANYSAYIDEIDPTPQSMTINSIVSPDPSKNPAQVGAIAPGELLQITGAKLGPANFTPGIINAGMLATSVAGVQVTFDGVAVPLLSVSAQQIELVTPFELSGKTTTTIQVQYNGSKSNAVQVPVTALEIQILGVFNDDFTVNSAANPAAPGSAMCLYIGGVGNADPPSQDGEVNAAPYTPLALPIALMWFMPNAGASALVPITFAGSAPGTAAGIFQINFPAPSETGGANLAQMLGPNEYGGGGSFQIYIKQ